MMGTASVFMKKDPQILDFRKPEETVSTIQTRVGNKGGMRVKFQEAVKTFEGFMIFTLSKK